MNKILEVTEEYIILKPGIGFPFPSILWVIVN